MARFTADESALTGYTDYFIVRYNDFTETTDDTAQTLTYSVSQCIVESVDMIIVEEFEDSSGGDELDVIVGDGGDADGFLPSAGGNADLHGDQGPNAIIAGAGAYVTASGKVYEGDDTIDFTFTPNRATGQSYALSELTAGEVHFFLRIRRASDHANPAS